MKVLNLCPVPPETFSSNLDPTLGVEIVNPPAHTAEAALTVADQVAMAVGDFSGTLRVDAELIAAMTRLRHFHQFSVGYDILDVEALTAAGIPLTNAGDVAAVAMAEYSVMATLGLLKSLSWCDRQVRDGAWPMHEVVARSLVELRSATVGLLGFGASARLTADRLRPFGCQVLYTARNRRPADVEAAHGVQWRTLDDLFGQSSVVIVLVDLNDSTRHMVDAARIATMPRGSFLVNPARAQIVDTAALTAALDSGHLGGAAVDVAEVEPPPADWPLRDRDTTLLTPHTAGATVETRIGMVQRTLDVIASVARHQLPEGVINGVTSLRQP
ncbi:MAG TPA: NAD(P)-dependent oxidoreductase [Euzebya sp.]|nr:NAD(P)-dependent oxidoreductase [Euzebya sp.]